MKITFDEINKGILDDPTNGLQESYRDQLQDPDDEKVPFVAWFRTPEFVSIAKALGVTINDDERFVVIKNIAHATALCAMLNRACDEYDDPDFAWSSTPNANHDPMNSLWHTLGAGGDDDVDYMSFMAGALQGALFHAKRSA